MRCKKVPKMPFKPYKKERCHHRGIQKYICLDCKHSFSSQRPLTLYRLYQQSKRRQNRLEEPPSKTGCDSFQINRCLELWILCEVSCDNGLLMKVAHLYRDITKQAEQPAFTIYSNCDLMMKPLVSIFFRKCELTCYHLPPSYSLVLFC